MGWHLVDGLSGGTSPANAHAAVVAWMDSCHQGCMSGGRLSLQLSNPSATVRRPGLHQGMQMAHGHEIQVIGAESIEHNEHQVSVRERRRSIARQSDLPTGKGDETRQCDHRPGTEGGKSLEDHNRQYASQRMRLPKADQVNCMASLAASLRLSRIGFTSTTSIDTSVPVSASSSIAR